MIDEFVDESLPHVGSDVARYPKAITLQTSMSDAAVADDGHGKGCGRTSDPPRSGLPGRPARYAATRLVEAVLLSRLLRSASLLPKAGCWCKVLQRR